MFLLLDSIEPIKEAQEAPKVAEVKPEPTTKSWKSTDWTQIKGIGAVKNKAILDMIDNLGSVDDLIKVHGIGKKTLEVIKDFLNK